MIKKFLLLSALLCLLRQPAPAAGSGDLELAALYVTLAYAGMCLKSMGIAETPESEQEGRKLGQMLAQKYGGKAAGLAIMGVREYEADKGVHCRRMLQKAKAYMNSHGLEGALYEQGLARLRQRK